MKDLLRMKEIRNLWTCGKSVVSGRTVRFFSMILMMLTLCVGNVWGTKISDCKLAHNAIDQNYPVPGVRYYVYATNPNTTSSYKDQLVFWTCATSTNYYQIKQTLPQDTTTDKNVPADALIVRIKVENNKPYIEADVDGNGTYKKLFFSKAGTSCYLIAQKGEPTNAAYIYYEPYWSFAYDNNTWQLTGAKYESTTATDTTWTRVCAKYTREGKSGSYKWLKFNTSATPLATAVKASPSGSSEAVSHTKWTFVKVPTTWYYSSTPGTSGYADATVQVSTDGDNWASSIDETSTTNEKVHLYFTASAAPSTHDFLGWYDGNTLKSTNLEYDVEVSGTGTSGNPTTFNYVAKYSQKQTVYYKLQGVTKTGQEERGSVHVSLNGTDWDEDGEIVGSIETSATQPQITVYFKGVPSGDSYTLSSFDYVNSGSISTRVSRDNWGLLFDPSTGVSTNVFTIKNANNHLSEANACLIDLKASFGKKAVYKGAVAKTTGSPANGCTVKVALTQDGLASATTETAVGSTAIADDKSSISKAIFFEASVDNTDPDRYRFNGWYDNAAKIGDVLSTEASFNKAFTVQFGQTAEQNTFTLYGDFSESTKKYYRAVAEASPNVGTVKAGFTSDLTSASPTANASAYNFNDSFNKTAYFEAELPSGYEFRGWSTTNDESGLIEGARSLTYHESFAVSSTNSDEPTIIKRYAIFRAIDAQEVQMWDADDTSLGKGDFADAIANSNVAKIKLLRSVTLANSATITAPATIDLDGFDIYGTTMTINPGVEKEVKFINTDSHGYGKINLNTEVNGISVTSGSLVLDGAGIKVIGSGDDTYGIVVGSSANLTLISSYVRVSALSTVYGLLVDGTASLEGGTINASSTNSFAVKTNAGSETSISGSAELIGTVNALKHTGGTVSILGGGFRGGLQDITYADASAITLHGGCFAHNAGITSLVSEPYVIVDKIPSGLKFSASDYNYMVLHRNSPNYPLCTVISKKENNPTLRYNFSTLEAAIAYANNNADDSREKTILLLENYTLPVGNYTIPHHTILSVPRSAEQTDAEPILTRINTNDIPTSAYCTLTLVDGVHIDVRGAIEVGGTQTAGNIDAAGSYGVSRPGGPTYGLMQMNSGSSITLYDESNFYAWGFVQGEGTIDVRRGATVKEQFQIMDWKGFQPTALMAVGGSIDYTLHVLPVNQYFIQNVEVKATYRPGSRLKAQVSACVQGFTLAFNDIGIIGIRYSDAEKAEDDDLKDDVAIFLMDNNDDSEDTWVRKSYDVANDVQLYEANNSAYLGSLLMDIDVSQSGIQFGGMNVQDLNVDSRDFVLPLANNFKIHLKNGTLVVTQNTVILPGAVMEIDKKATMTITDQVWKKVGDKFQWVTEPQTLYVYDKDQWGTYVFDKKPGDNYIMGYGARIRYRHGGLVKERTLTPEGLGHGKLIVHGTVDVKGYLKTTNGDKTATPVISQTDKGKDYVSGVTETTRSSSTGGASITSTIADAGTITLSRDAGYVTSGWHSSYIWQVDRISSGGTPSYFGNHAIPAWLTNEVGSVYSGADGYTETAGTRAGNSFCFIDFDGDGKGEWVSLVEDGCFVKNGNDYYAKPKDYVKLLHGKTAEDDHTYKSADGTRTLILVDDCQWWEVVQVEGHPDLFECKHKNNHVFYYYDYEKSKWKEKRYKVTWLNWDADTIEVYSMKYGVKPQYLGTIYETRQPDAYYTYDFIGWAPEITDQTIVTADVTYTAQYERKDVMYTVTWKDMAGNTIETGYYKIGDVPTCTSADMTNKEWTPAVGAVTGNTIYQLTSKNTDGPFDIKFMNWNGVQIGETQSVAKNAVPVAPADPSKPALTDIEFVFAGWRAANNEVYASNAIPAATENAVYTATFTEKPIVDTIIWKKGQDTLLVQYVTPNTVPQYTGATPSNGEEYAFIGWTPTVVAATTDAEYTAVFELRERTVDGGTYTIPASTQQSLTTITITDDGVLSIPASSSMTVTNLILEANGSASGQIIAPSNSNIITVNAYYDLNLDIDGRHWFAFGVPWAVDINTDKLVEVDNDGNVVRTLHISRDYEIMYYDGAERAANGPSTNCWKYLRHYNEPGQPVEVLQPGRGYMIAFGSHVNTVRFTKKSGAPIMYTGDVTVQAEGTGTNQGINAVSNPMAYHANMDLAGVGQVHDGEEIGSDGYDPVTIANMKYIVGKTVYIQVENEQTISPSNGISPVVAASPAPRRAARATDKKYLTLEDYYTIALTNSKGEARKLYVLPEEEKEDQYVIGHDLVHMGMSTKKAQIWTKRYDANLCLNTTAPINEAAEFPVNLYAPSAGEFTISLASQPDDGYAVYLTNNGRVVWNLSDAEYMLDLPAGVNNQYGLRLVKNAPQITTGIDEAVVDAKGETCKVLINNQVYIIRGNNVYSVDGQMVK